MVNAQKVLRCSCAEMRILLFTAFELIRPSVKYLRHECDYVFRILPSPSTSASSSVPANAYTGGCKLNVFLNNK